MLSTRTIIALLALGFTGAVLPLNAAEAAASPAEPRASGDKDGWERAMENILAKEGISLSGNFRSQYLHSSISGLGAVSTRRSEESLEYTSVDFDVRARPNSLTQGRLVFRMHQDWRNFFSDVGNPISSRWISIDGEAKGIFRYNVGDFRQRYSALTLHSPDIAVMYEPDLYASQRRNAMDEVFLGNNDRLLQGVNLNLDASVDNDQTTLLRELHLNVLGSRLRSTQTAIQDGSKPTAFVELSPFEKFLGASNLDLALPFGLSAGGSYMYIFDKKGSYNPTIAATNAGQADSAAQSTHISAGRAGIDVGSLLASEKLSLGLSAEYARSSDDSTSIRGDTLNSQSIVGTALLARFNAGWKAGSAFGLKVNVDFHRNDADYRNELAQSPTFRGERILNLENDTTGALSRVVDPRAAQYTSFDAMYRHAFKFSPSSSTNLWHKAPFTKNSYNNSIATQSELATFAARRIDTALQLVMPFGPATANRSGISSNLTFSTWDDKVEVQALATLMDEMEGRSADSVRVLPKTAFTQAGGGLKLEVGSMLGLPYPLTLAGSLVRSTSKNAGLAGDTVFVARDVQSDFINTGLRYKFWKRAALLGAYQEIRTRNTRAAADAEEIQKNMGGGLEYKIAEGAYAIGSLNRVSVAPPAGSPNKEFSQFQTDIFLTVRF